MDSPLINYLRWFTYISPEDEALISAAFTLRNLREGDVLFNAGQVCKELFFICGGVLRIMTNNDKGVAVTYFFLKENQFCTILNSFTNNVVAHEGIQAACDGQVLAISRSNLNELYQHLPYLKDLIESVMHQALLDKIKLKNGYQGLDSTARYQLFRACQTDVALRVSLSDVASYLGITPQSLSRIRKNIR